MRYKVKLINELIDGKIVCYTGESIMELTYETIGVQQKITLLKVIGRVDGSNYLRLIEYAEKLFKDGAEEMFIDLEGCIFLSSAGLFALHNLALMAHHYPRLDQEDGWGAMHKIANEHRVLKERLKIIAAPPGIIHTLEVTGLSALYALYPDVKTAMSVYESI